MQEKLSILKEIKFLFVEDEEVLINIISSTLNKLGVNFVVANNGKEALDILDTTSDIEMVVTDINMPVMNGLEFIEKVRTSDKEYKDIPIVIMSAHTESEYRNIAQKLGITEYLLKPFDFMKFIDLMYNFKQGKI